MSKPAAFDLDAYEAEASREPFRFTYNGEEFELAHTDAIDWHDLSDPSPADLIKVGLGPEQWERFTALKISGGAYRELQRRWFAHAGVSLGNERA